MKKLITLSVLASMLLTTTYAVEFNYNNKSDIAVSISANFDKESSPIIETPSSKLLAIQNDINRLEFQVEQFPKDLLELETRLDEVKKTRLSIINRIKGHLKVSRYSDHDNPYVREAMKSSYNHHDFGDKLVSMRETVNGFISELNRKMAKANQKVEAIPPLINIIAELKAQKKILEGGVK